LQFAFARGRGDPLGGSTAVSAGGGAVLHSRYAVDALRGIFENMVGANIIPKMASRETKHLVRGEKPYKGNNKGNYSRESKAPSKAPY
jgi:hypothetical protein